MRLSTSILIGLTAASLAGADTLVLRGGDVVQGTYLGGNARQVRIDVNGNVQSFDVGQVRSITFSDEGFQTPPRARVYPADGNPPQNEARTTYPPPNQTRQPSFGDDQVGLTIPADTPITIRMIDAVNSETARLGQTFRASVDEPVTVNGQQVIPRGVDVLTKLVADERSGKIQGRTVLTLALVNININGRPVDVTSSDVQTASASRGARTGKVVGGTAALGAIIGGIAGGGAGAGIGALSGAAVGGGVQVLTAGQQVKIPSETRLTFRLQAPVQL